MGKSDEQIERESDKRIKAASKKALPSSVGRTSGIGDWINADASLIHRLVCVISGIGGAVRFGYTRDGGAYSIGLYLGENSKTYYCNEEQGINDELKELIEWFEK